MWVDRDRSWLKTVIVGGFALPHIWWRTLVVTGISLVVTVVYESVPAVRYPLTAAPFTLVGLPLGIFLGFRNNTAYDRFWEGRKLWGSLVNTSRSLTRQIITLIEPHGPDGHQLENYRTAAAVDESTRAEIVEFEAKFVHLLIGFVHALRHHLRDTSPFEALGYILGKEETERLQGRDNVPLMILQRMGERLVEARRKGWIHPVHVPVLEGSLTSLTDIQGACERIKSTPMPFSYTVLLHRIVALYCTFLPFGLMDVIKWATPAVVLVMSYCFFGLDSIGDELEQPFGKDVNDLPLKAISRTIERNLRAMLGEAQPPPVEPARGVLT